MTTNTGQLFIANVDRLLDEYGWLRQDLAAEMGVTPQYVSQVLSGTINVSLAVVEKFAAGLDCKVEDLVSESHLTKRK